MHILLVSYVFPPYYGIGGKRWAKQADALTRRGHTIHVICAKNPFKEQSLWTDLVRNNPNIIVHQLPARFPKTLVRIDHSFAEKIAYKLWISLLPMLTRGSYLDRTMLWKGVMLRKARHLISKYGIKHVICSGGPFGAMQQVTLLKSSFSDLCIINDLRDPWTWGPNWGFHDLDASRMKYEQQLEREMVEHSNLVTVPTLEMQKFMHDKYPSFKNKITTLFHFFDQEEIAVEHKTLSPKLRLVFYGTIYHHIPELIEEAARVIAGFGDKVSLDIYTDKLQHKQTFEKYNANNVKFHKLLPAKELFAKFKNFDYVLMTIPNVGADHISTKFYEIIYSKTPILAFCRKGLAADFVVENRLGVHAGPGELENVLKRLVSDKTLKDYNDSFDLSGYSLEDNARTLETMLLNCA